jgi:hypothetical protein
MEANMEELKLILDTFQTLGGDAKVLAIVYFSIQALSPILTASVVSFLITCAYKVLMFAMKHEYGDTQNS